MKKTLRLVRVASLLVVATVLMSCQAQAQAQAQFKQRPVRTGASLPGFLLPPPSPKFTVGEMAKKFKVAQGAQKKSPVAAVAFTSAVVTAPKAFNFSEIILPNRPFLWGSEASVLYFASTNIDTLVSSYLGTTTSGQLISLSDPGYVVFNSFPNYAAVDSAFHQAIVLAGENALAAAPANIDPRVPLVLQVSGYTWNYLPSYNYPAEQFVLPPTSVQLVKSGTKYVLPDLSELSLPLTPQIVYYVPGLQWVRIEVYSTNNLVNPVLVSDSRDGSGSDTTYADVANQTFFIGTDYITSGSTGPFRLRVSYLTITSTSSAFVIVNGDGMQVVENPLVLAMPVFHGQNVSTLVSGGDIGRCFQVLASSDLKVWTPVGTVYTVGANPVPVSFTDSGLPSIPGIRSQRFYRTVAVNQVPK